MSTAPAVPTPGRSQRGQLTLLLGVVAVLTAGGWTVLALGVVPRHLAIGGQVFGFGLGLTAYTLGVRHAFDADHIAAIDNTTRRLLAAGRRSVSTGFWFALGHSTVVALLAAAVSVGTRFAVDLADDRSTARAHLQVVSTGVSGLFLCLIGVLNLVALVGLARLYRRSRADPYDHDSLEEMLDRRGLFNRLLRPLLRSVRHPGQMYPVGLLFGLGFDTATEVTLLALAGSGAAAQLPWYAVLVLPLLFTAGMTLFDTLDGAFMTVAYRWAFAEPLRKLYYNITITGLSVVVALLIGSIELVALLRRQLQLRDPVSGWVAGLDLNHVGFLVVALFVVVWVGAIAYWKIARVPQRRAAAVGPETSRESAG